MGSVLWYIAHHCQFDTLSRGLSGLLFRRYCQLQAPRSNMSKRPSNWDCKIPIVPQNADVRLLAALIEWGKGFSHVIHHWGGSHPHGPSSPGEFKPSSACPALTLSSVDRCVEGAKKASLASNLVWLSVHYPRQPRVRSTPQLHLCASSRAADDTSRRDNRFFQWSSQSFFSTC